MEEASFYAIQIANAPYFFSRQNYNNSKSRLYRKNLSPSLPHLYISSKCIIFYTIVEINRNKSLDFSTYVKFWFSISSWTVCGGSTWYNITSVFTQHGITSLLFSLNMSFTHRKRLFFTLNELSSPLFFHQHGFQSTVKKNNEFKFSFGVLCFCSARISINTDSTQHVFQSTLFSLNTAYHLH